MSGTKQCPQCNAEIASDLTDCGNHQPSTEQGENSMSTTAAPQPEKPTKVEEGIGIAATVAQSVAGGAPAAAGESTVAKVVEEAASVASIFVKSQPAVAALQEAYQLSPVFIHFGFFLAHLFQAHHNSAVAAAAAGAPQK